MAGLFGIDGPVAVFFLVLIFYGAPIVFSFTYKNFYALVGVFGLFILVSLYTLVRNPSEYFGSLA